MSGVKVGTRLEQLEALHSRVTHELQAERLAVARGERRTPSAAPTPYRQARDLVMDRLDNLTPLPAASVIRAWAIAQGYLAETQRTGPIPTDVCDLYREQVMG
jgi:hypothetical protein